MGLVAIRRPPTLRLWQLLSHVRRLGWGVADQAMSSVSNFAIVAYAAHTVGAAAFGAFSLAYITWQVSISASRGVATDPLLVRYSGVDLQTWRRAVGSCTGTGAVVGMVAGACVLVAAAVLSGTAKFAFLAVGLAMPALLLQDSWRFSFFAAGRGGQAFLNDLIWSVALIPALVLLRAARAQSVFWLILAWGAAAAVAAAAGLLQARVVPRPSDAKRWLSQHRDLGYRYMAENVANTGSSQVRASVLGLIVGLAAVGYLQAVTTLVGPVVVLSMGMSMIGIPEAARILRRSPQRLLLFCLLVSGGLAVAALAWGAVLLVALPRGLGTLVLGSIWRPTYPLVVPFVLALVGICAAWVGPIIGLHALGAARRSLRAMLFASVASLPCSLVGALFGGILGAVWGLAISMWLGTLLWWWELFAAMRESGVWPLRHASASGLASSDVLSSAVNEPDRQLEYAGTPGWSAEPHRSSPWAEAQSASSSAVRSVPPSSLRALLVPPNRSTPASEPATPPLIPTGWSAVIASDRTYYDRAQKARNLSNCSVTFPAYSDERRIPLAGIQMRVGRRRATSDFEPEIDLSDQSADPGVSRLHAVLIPTPDGTWAVLDPGSTNGTLLNGRKIAIGDAVPLRDGDRINLGAWTVITVRRH
jgi:O-antigen/teichoic acid export membrane protein